MQRYFEIYLLSVRSEYGGKGIGKQLLEHSLQVAKKRDVLQSNLISRAVSVERFEKNVDLKLFFRNTVC